MPVMPITVTAVACLLKKPISGFSGLPKYFFA
jgi:hypothetical protein